MKTNYKRQLFNIITVKKKIEGEPWCSVKSCAWLLVGHGFEVEGSPSIKDNLKV